MKAKYDRIIFNIEPALKNDFSRCCKDVGVNMTDVIKASIVKFIEESKQKPR